MKHGGGAFAQDDFTLDHKRCDLQNGMARIDFPDVKGVDNVIKIQAIVTQRIHEVGLPHGSQITYNTKKGPFFQLRDLRYPVHPHGCSKVFS